MGSLDQLNGLDKPETRNKITVAKDFKTILTESYLVWCNFVKNQINPKEILHTIYGKTIDTIDTILNEAERILLPNENLFPEVIDISDYCIIAPDALTLAYSGIFYTAILNISEKERKLIVKGKEVGDYYGYRIKKGIIELHSRNTYPGWFADGGMIVSYAYQTYFANFANNGIFINNYPSTYFGDESQNGIFINKNSVFSFGQQAKNGLYLNFGNVKEFFGDYAHGIFINQGLPRTLNPKYRGLFINLNSILKSWFFSDSKLEKLLKELLYVSTEKIDMQAIKRLGACIVEHCQKEYKNY